MSDELLDKLGNYFVHYGIAQHHGITFERFIREYDNGTWTLWIS
ncbi:hypothetical protein YDYSY3_57410 [Paenibacillus chitinolyticus]|nr:hypothetical protein [Paenibacillus chitinolyticus]GKS14741.1 hypothetical protein YDYSY3_57410 [Paenibacillus chitinolyticus]